MQLLNETYLIMVVVLFWYLLAMNLASTETAPQQQPPPKEGNNTKIGGSGRVAVIEIEPGQAQMMYQGTNYPLEAGLAGGKPDFVVIKIRGRSWKALFDAVLQNDIAVSVQAEE